MNSQSGNAVRVFAATIMMITALICHPAVAKPRLEAAEPSRIAVALPLLQGPRGRPRCRPNSAPGGRAYDAKRIRRALRSRRILPRLATRNTKHGSGLGRWRWVVERTFAWLSQFRRDASKPTLRTDQESSQPNRTALEYWAGGLEPIYLEGALVRAQGRLL